MHPERQANWRLVLRHRQQARGLQLLPARSSPTKSSQSASSLICYIITIYAVSSDESTIHQILVLASDLTHSLPHGRACPRLAEQSFLRYPAAVIWGVASRRKAGFRVNMLGREAMVRKERSYRSGETNDIASCHAGQG